ncbi:MAG: hypothetical protein EOO02_07110 [Chitinophagaceae bacterium]|nr:MAG: hypothetical protein EOO02_07110 [Chitinophagaceae bacterium]
MSSRLFTPFNIFKSGVIRVLAFASISLSMATGCSKDDQLTLRNEEFPITAVAGSGVSGTVFIAENLDSTFTITVKLNSTVKDTVHIMNIYNSGQSGNADISVKLVDIIGTGSAAIGETKNITQIIQNTGNYESVNYDEVLRNSKTLKVFYSKNQPDSLIAMATVGR